MTEDCIVHENFKTAFRRARAREAMAAPQFDSRLPVIPVRALKNKGTDDFNRLQFEIMKKIDNKEMDRIEAQMKIEEYWIGGLHKAVIDGDVENGSLMAGQAVGLAEEVKPVKDMIEELVCDGENELKRVADNF